MNWLLIQTNGDVYPQAALLSSSLATGAVYGSGSCEGGSNDVRQLQDEVNLPSAMEVKYKFPLQLSTTIHHLSCVTVIYFHLQSWCSYSRELSSRAKKCLHSWKGTFESNESDKSPKIKGKEQTVYTHFFEFLLIFIIIQSSNLIVPSHLCVNKSIFPHGLQVTSCWSGSRDVVFYDLPWYDGNVDWNWKE